MISSKTAYWITGAVAVTIIGVIVIPPLIKKYGNKIYKSSLKNDDPIDFDSMGPEIVKKDNVKEDSTNGD